MHNSFNLNWFKVGIILIICFLFKIGIIYQEIDGYFDMSLHIMNLSINE